jgi:hypothetical protein
MRGLRLKVEERVAQRMIEEQLQRDLKVKEVAKRFVRQYKLDKNLVERSIRQLIGDGFLLAYEEIHKQLVERLSIRIGPDDRN